MLKVPSVTSIVSEQKISDDECCDEEESEESQQNPAVAALALQIHTNDINGMKRLLSSLRSKDEIKECVNQRDEAGKSPLDVSAALGRVEITKLLIMLGAKIDSYTSKGYTCLHHAAAWGRQKTLKLLVDSGGNYLRKNVHGETPLDIAKRYNQLDCVEFLELLVEKKRLQTEITRTLEKMKDIDRTSGGRITKEEKNMVINACMEKQEWLDIMAATASSQEVQAQLLLLTQASQPLFRKLSETCKLLL